MTDKERIEKEVDLFSKTLTKDWHRNEDARLCYIAGATAERNKAIDECIAKIELVIKEESATLRNFIRLELESLKI